MAKQRSFLAEVINDVSYNEIIVIFLYLEPYEDGVADFYKSDAAKRVDLAHCIIVMRANI